MHSFRLSLALAIASVVNAIVDNISPFYPFGERQSSNTTCDTDRDTPPGDLTQCGNSTLFFVWRPKARFIAPEGWMNDPQGLFQRADGSFHAGYQCHPQHYQWGNISQCSAFSNDLTYWQDGEQQYPTSRVLYLNFLEANGWENPITLWPSEIYDIRGVFDGSIIPNGWNGYPTTIYASTFPGPLGATSSPPEQEGTETQSIAYTTDGGASWTKLAFGSNGNPVIYEWPMQNLTGFRDPYAFESPIMSKMLQGIANKANGPHFLTISGGIRADSGQSSTGSRLMLYRQTSPNDLLHWTYLGPLLSPSGLSSFSEWSGNFGINFETSAVTRLNEHGMAYDDGSDPRALNIFGLGTEQGRNGSHENHWPLWAAATFHNEGNGINSSLDAVGVFDWGRVYATIFFPVSGNRSVLVGWTYEDDENLVLTAQRGYQGAFTLFRDLFLKVTRNVDPSSPGLSEKGSWKVWDEADGSKSVVTLGQRIVPETLQAYRSSSTVSSPTSINFNGTAGYKPFQTQPLSAHYAINAVLRFQGSTPNLPQAGFRVLASDQEYTDIYYDPKIETLVIDRTHSTLITSYGNGNEIGKLRLWNITTTGGMIREDLHLTIIVDGSVVEVYANDVTIITTRAYPWLLASKGAGFLVQNGGDADSKVYYSDMELWDGLIDAWPDRPTDTRKGLVYDGPLTNGSWNLWTGT